MLVLQKAVGTILKIGINEIGGGSLANAGNCLFRVIGNSLEFPITQKGTNVPMMRTRAKQKHVASDRARRENVPRYIFCQDYMSSESEI